MKKLSGSLLVFGLLLVSTGAWAQGAIDNTSIGLTTPQAGKFTNLEATTLEATTSIKLGAETITNFSGLDDDKVKVSSGDTADFLESQIVGGTGVTVNSDGSQITISAPPVNVQDSSDGVETTFAREFEFDAGTGLLPALDLNGTDLFIGSTDPTITLGGQTRTVLSKGTIPNTNPTLQQVVVDLPSTLFEGEHKLKVTNANGFSEGFISLSEIDFGGDASFTKLLLHADGTGQTFTDSSASAHTITANGDATQSATQSQFGGKSASFDGTGDYLSVPYSSDFDFSDQGDFTVDYWIYLLQTTKAISVPVARWQSFPTANRVWTMALTGNTGSGFTTIDFTYFNGGNRGITGTTGANASSFNFQWDTWYHIAAIRNGNSLKVYVDGVEKGSSNDLATYNITNNTGIDLRIGNGHDAGEAGTFVGYIDELRISKGVARSTKGFRSPEVPYN